MMHHFPNILNEFNFIDKNHGNNSASKTKANLFSELDDILSRLASNVHQIKCDTDKNNKNKILTKDSIDQIAPWNVTESTIKY